MAAQLKRADELGGHLGLRREAARHAAFDNQAVFASIWFVESGVAAAALPPQSKMPSDWRTVSAWPHFILPALIFQFPKIIPPLKSG